MGIERIALKHHRDTALRWRQVVAALAVDRDLAGGDGLEPGDQAQQRRLSAARRPDEHDELAVVNGQADAADDLAASNDFRISRSSTSAMGGDRTTGGRRSSSGDASVAHGHCDSRV